MEFTGRYQLPAAPDAVWSALRDPDVLHACIPGCEGVNKLPDETFQATATVKVGPVKARFSGRVKWIEQTPPQGFTHAGILSGEGQGGAAGFAKGQSEVRLAAEKDGTLLTYDARATVGGKLAQVGQRLIDATARSMADAFFAKFAELMGAHADVAPAASDTSARRPRPEEGLKPQIWVVGLVAIVIVLLIVFSLVL